MHRVDKSIVVNAPVEECYLIWSDFTRFSDFMKNVKSIHSPGEEGVWHWEVLGPLGKTVAWDAEVQNIIPMHTLSWHSIGINSLGTSGTVNFHKLDDNRTLINVDMAYEPAFGTLGEFAAILLKNPDRMVVEDMMNFKRFIEGHPGQVIPDNAVGSGSRNNPQAVPEGVNLPNYPTSETVNDFG